MASEALPKAASAVKVLQLGGLAFSSIKALASMAESKTTICILAVSVVLGVGCLIGKLIIIKITQKETLFNN